MTERQTISACVFRSGQTTTFTRPPHVGLHQGLSDFTLSGPILAYTETQFGVDSGCTSIYVTDLATKLGLLSVPAGCFVDAGFIRLAEVTSLVVNEHGDVAWIIATGRRSAQSYEVRTGVRFIDENKLVEASAAIAPGSLRLAPGGQISWLDAGRSMFAPLVGPTHP
jgi:hypothetical protein